MLEGKEIDGQIGQYGEYKVGISGQGVVEISLGIKVDLMAELHKLAAKTSTQLDDDFLAVMDKLLGKSDAPAAPSSP